MDYKLLKSIAFIILVMSICSFNLTVFYTAFTVMPISLFFIIFVIFIEIFYIKNYFVNLLIAIVALPCFLFLSILDIQFSIQRACPGGWNEGGRCDK
jgi:hypothetical protein